MGGAPITVVCYRNGILSYGGQWIQTPEAIARAREIAQRDGLRALEDVIWDNREAWTRELTDAWPAVDSFAVALRLDQDYTPTPAAAARDAGRASGAKKRGRKK